MAVILTAYTALTSTSPRADVAAVLKDISHISPLEFDTASHPALINALLSDLKLCTTVNSNQSSRLAIADVPPALTALKNLGKNLHGSAILATPTNLALLLTISKSPALQGIRDATQIAEAENEALRCVANAMLLVDEARNTFLGGEVKGGDICVALLDVGSVVVLQIRVFISKQKATTPDQIFILSRLLFLATVSGPSFVQTLVEDSTSRSVIEIVDAKLEDLTASILGGARMAKEAMGDLLKFTYNILLHYPKMVECEPQNEEAEAGDDAKVMGDFWSSKLDGFLPPLLRTFNSLPPTFPSPIAAPLTYVIHGLIAIPLTPSLRIHWIGTAPHQQLQTASSGTNTPRIGPSSTSSSRSDSPTRPGGGSSSPRPTTLDRALSVISAGRHSLSRSSSPNPPSRTNLTSNPNADVLQRVFDLLEVSFSHYFPGDIDPDEPEVRERCRRENPPTSSGAGENGLDDILSPLVVLLTRMCTADDGCRRRVRQAMVPDDMDRTNPLERRSDLLGRCLRILGSVYHVRLKDSVGEMLFAMADSNPSTLSALFGYGNVAGYLFNKGFMSAPPADPSSSTASLTTPSGAAINPITGPPLTPAPMLHLCQTRRKNKKWNGSSYYLIAWKGLVLFPPAKTL
ncbi:guanine nucleotide exchange factor [Infundibulicybe gibba]|nr:guanine nucleotide exchange factor [Infundibulicybe gibba]